MDINNFTVSQPLDNVAGNLIYANNNFVSNQSSENDPKSLELSINEQVMQIINYYYTPLLVFAGTIGNIISILVFFKTKLKKLSSSYYLAALGVSDTGFLMIIFAQWLNVLDVSVYNHYFMCPFFTYLSGLCSFLSVWFVVAFTVERFIAVLYPLKRQSMCTVRRAKMVLCGLTVMAALHCAPFMMYSTLVFYPKLNGTICDVPYEFKSTMLIYNIFDTVVCFVVPFTTIVILNTFTGYTVWRVAGVRRTMTLQKRKHFTVPKCTHPSGHHSIKQSCPKTSRQRVANSSQLKVTKMLLIVSSTFVCLNLPSYVIRMTAFLKPTGEEGRPIFYLIQFICYQLFNTNFGINFVLYCVSGQNFRKAIKSMLWKTTHHKQETGTQVTVSEYIRSTGSNTSRRRTVTRNGSWADLHELRMLAEN